MRICCCSTFFLFFLGTGRPRVRSPKATDFATDVHLGFRKQGGWTEQLTVRRKSFLDFRPTLHFEKGYSVFSYMIIMIYQVDCRSFGAGQAGGTNIYRSILISERIDGGWGWTSCVWGQQHKNNPKMSASRLGYWSGWVKDNEGYKFIVRPFVETLSFHVVSYIPFACLWWLNVTPQVRIMKTFDDLNPLESSVELDTFAEEKNEWLLGFDESFVITNEEGCIKPQGEVTMENLR